MTCVQMLVFALNAGTFGMLGYSFGLRGERWMAGACWCLSAAVMVVLVLGVAGVLR